MVVYDKGSVTTANSDLYGNFGPDNLNGDSRNKFSLQCPDGKYIKTVSGKSGSNIDSETLTCTSGESITAGYSTGGSDNGSMTCDAGINSVNINYNDTFVGLKYNCADGQTFSQGTITSQYDNMDNYRLQISCPAGMYLNGVSGTAGYLNKVDKPDKDTHFKNNGIRQMRFTCGYKADCTNASKNDIFSSACSQYVANNETVANQIKTSYCNKAENVTSPDCLSYCRQNVGACDDGAQDFCKKNPFNNTFCSCIPANALQALAAGTKTSDSDLAFFKRWAPICWNNTCQSTAGFKTASASIASKSCPSCVQIADIGSLSLSDSAAAINQSCNVDGTVQASTSTVVTKSTDSGVLSDNTPVSTTTAAPTSSSSSIALDTKTMVIAGASIVIASGLLFLLTSSPKSR